jgi:molybdopterin-guanine dinucleotide biosynthesis protein A
MSEAPLYGLVLSGGKSRRMGRDKALLERDGKSQLAHITELLERHVERVFVSTRPGQEKDPERNRYRCIVDRYDHMGPLAGILSAMDEHPHVDWLVAACDLPNIDDETIGYLLANRSAGKPFTAFTSSHDELPEPLCAVWRAGTGAIIAKFVKEGIHCPRKILIRSDTHLLEQIDPRSLDNVNTPGDLADSVLEAAS